MITFRYHIVTIVSVFLALAVGIALGGGPLKGEVDNSLVSQVEADRERIANLTGQITGLETGTAYSDDVVRGLAPTLLAGRLTGLPVAIVALPGSSATVVADLADTVRTAGAEVAGTYRVGAALLDAGQRELVDDLGARLASEAPDLVVPEGSSGYERIGAVIARAIGTAEPGGAPVDPTTTAVLAGLATTGLLSADGEPVQRGSLVLVVTGSPSLPPPGATGGAAPGEDPGRRQIVTTLARAIAASTGGAVLAGPTPAAREGGLVAALRADVQAAREVSTVDSVNRASGQLVVALALAGRAAGTVGHYGAVEAADGALPPLTDPEAS